VPAEGPLADGHAPSEDLTALFALLRSADPGAQPGESAALVAFRELVPVRPVRRTPLQWIAESRARFAVVASVGVLTLGGGVAAAATGALPGPAQSAAHAVFGTIGVGVPNGGGHGNGVEDTAPGVTGQHPGPMGLDASETPPARPAHPAHPVTPTDSSRPGYPSTPAHPSRPVTPNAHASSHPTPSVRPTPSRRPVTPPTPAPSSHR
jgi:hypothetical protein